MSRRGSEGIAKIKDSADGTVYTLEFGRQEAAGITMKVGDTVTVEGTSQTRNSVNELQIWTFTGADGKTLTLRKAEGTPNIETVSVAGMVTEITQATATAPSTDKTTKPAPKAMTTIKVKQADGTIVAVVLGCKAADVTVKGDDTVKIEGFKMSTDATTIMATSFTGTDGKTITLGGKGFGSGDIRGGQGAGRGSHDGTKAPGFACAVQHIVGSSSQDVRRPSLQRGSTISGLGDWGCQIGTQ